MNASEFIKQLEKTLRQDATEKTEQYLNARKGLYGSPARIEVKELQNYRNLRRLWRLSIRKYDCFMESLDENIFSLS